MLAKVWYGIRSDPVSHIGLTSKHLVYRTILQYK